MLSFSSIYRLHGICLLAISLNLQVSHSVSNQSTDRKPPFLSLSKFVLWRLLEFVESSRETTQENELVRPVFEEWLKPFEDMGCSTIAIRNTGGTDHLSFDRVGLPGFQFIQDDIEYERGYHSVMDTYERLVMADLKQNAVITASFVYNAAMRNAKLPGKPVMKPRPNADQVPRM